MIPKIYSGDVTRRILMPDDTQANVQLNHTIVDKETDKEYKIANLALMRYTCSARPGPAYNSVREEFVTMMTEWGRSDPEALMAVRDLIVNNMDVPNARELARRFKMLVPKHLLRPEDAANIPEPPQPPPTPEQQADMAKAEAQQARAQADVQIAQISVEGEQLRLQQEQEQTRQAQLKTQAESVKLEVVTEKGAADIDGAEEEGADDDRIANVARRAVAKAEAEKRR